MYFWDGTDWVAARTSARPARRESRTANWTATALMLLVAALFVVPFSTAFAGSKTQSWISLAQSSGAAAVGPSLGSTVSFDAGYPSSVNNPRIEVACYQSGVLVYGEAGGVNDTFRLGGGGSAWLSSGGPANCVANLFYFGQHAGKQTYNKLASTSFAAAG